jgi:hypothetical protein
MSSRILGAMTGPVTCPAADKLSVIANGRRNCWPRWDSIPRSLTEGLFPKFLFWRKITHAGPIDRGRLRSNIIMPPPGFSLV